MSIIHVYPFIALLVLLTAIIQLLLPIFVKNKPIYTVLAFLFSLSILLIQVDKIPVFYYVRGFYIGDLSISTTLIFSAFVIQRTWGKEIYQPAETKYLMFLVILGGLFLYPLTLGLGQFDPYRLGYQPQIKLFLLFFIGLYFWHKQFYFLVFVLTSTVVCFNLRFLESNNLWDYLIDPALLLVFIIIGLQSALMAGIKWNKARVYILK